MKNYIREEWKILHEKGKLETEKKVIDAKKSISSLRAQIIKTPMFQQNHIWWYGTKFAGKDAITHS